LRAARGWSQEEAADQAGVTDRLIRKAEAGKPIELRSIGLLAAAYSTPDHPILPADLLLGKSDETIRTRLSLWLDKIWNQQQIDTINELTHPDIKFHCEKGLLQGSDQLRKRICDIQSRYHNFKMSIEQLDVQGDVVVCRWRMTINPRPAKWKPILPPGESFPCLTSMRFVDGRIVEGWEFWSPRFALRKGFVHFFEGSVS
jgi:transcriptional regulator with XRE-family HTH domain